MRRSLAARSHEADVTRGGRGVRVIRTRAGGNSGGLNAVRLRATPEAGDGTFEAYTSVYGVEYEVGGYFFTWLEVIQAGAFDASIASQPAIPIYYEHDWDAGPIGEGKPTSDDHGVLVKGQLYIDLGDYVQRIYRAMKAEALREWSIAFWPEEILTSKDRPELDTIITGDLAESSVCVRGANPETETVDLRRRGFYPLQVASPEARRRAALTVRTAVASHSTATSDSSWDGPGQEAKLEGLPGSGPKMYAWKDADGDLSTKAAWKFPHHIVSDAGAPGAANEKACTSIIGILNGGQGGADIPDSDRNGVYNHAKRHLQDAGVEDIPELKAAPEPAARADDEPAGHAHQHTHSDGTSHDHHHTHAAGNYEHGTDDTDPDREVAHEHGHPAGDGDQGDGPSEDSEAARARLLALIPNSATRAYALEGLAALSSSPPAPSPA